MEPRKRFPHDIIRVAARSSMGVDHSDSFFASTDTARVPKKGIEVEMMNALCSGDMGQDNEESQKISFLSPTATVVVNKVRSAGRQKWVTRRQETELNSICV